MAELSEEKRDSDVNADSSFADEKTDSSPSDAGVQPVNLAPEIAAEFVLGDYIDKLLGRKKSAAHSEQNESEIEPVHPAPPTPEVDLFDISDTAVESFLQTIKSTKSVGSTVNGTPPSTIKNKPQTHKSLQARSEITEELQTQKTPSPKLPNLKETDDEASQVNIEINPSSNLLEETYGDESVVNDATPTEKSAADWETSPPRTDIIASPETEAPIATDDELAGPPTPPIEPEFAETEDDIDYEMPFAPVWTDEDLQFLESFIEDEGREPAAPDFHANHQANETNSEFDDAPEEEILEDTEEPSEGTVVQLTAAASYDSGQVDSPAAKEQELNEEDLLLLRGIQNYRKRNYEDAIIQFNKLLKINPNFKAAYRILGSAYFKNKMVKEAIAIYHQLKKLHPKDTYCYENLGLIYLKYRKLEMAQNEWQKLLSLNPNRTDIKAKLTLISKKLKKQTQPSPIFTIDEKIRLLLAGIEHYKNKDFESAIRIFKHTIHRYPSAKEAYSFLGNAYFRNKMLDEAIHAYQKVKKFDGRSQIAHENMGVIYAHQGEYKLALDEWKKVLSLNPHRQDIIHKIKRLASLV
ncbi:MAG: tetratricopeptide repeat protein [bacterium]